MAKFIYRMQNILDIKLKMEDQAKASFAEANKELLIQEEKLEGLIRRREEYELEGQRLRLEKLNVIKLKDNSRALQVMKDMIKAQEMVVSIARDKVELARRKLQVAMQERKTQEKLKENAFEEFKHELNSEESKEVDELVSYRFGSGSGDN
ncbi:flagellar export protein FliJ [Lacrimispora saccharolytica]|uniref:flagellar export protein FliJ n=1 Tax=Lacrimispora saccharolytica TaxID=84030 RepID=UPI001B4BEC5A|nr:flagellar export protein FliJ [Lacrimispora saccharolytica]MBP9000583.1 flagellar export protein FliJ [Lachnospiraceae bacterium]MCF2655799.1 flagellar export protein FliJ [Lacrimispora saccharolytica]MCI7557277.1 flagellar export protein FliJ [Lachnospiraceae bacterium]MDD7547598.1 flagellar export protein FliJ [Lachnospiraceae bacterium]MDY4126970.1 flagellar export protein FliJ [Lachnospiraceae bacterium]